MKLPWLKDFIHKELFLPYTLEKDSDYYSDLSKKYLLVENFAKEAHADDDSLNIIRKFRSKILESLRAYYKADIAKSNTIILNLIKDIGEDRLAVDKLHSSDAFHGDKSSELQFFRCRTGNPPMGYSAKDMLHLPLSLRSKTGNYRFSIPGNPSFYLSNSSYGCWIESGYPSESNFNVSFCKNICQTAPTFNDQNPPIHIA